jgi:HEAT repeat protein
VWFVRLRAIVSLGRLCDPSAIPSLLNGLTDSNRLVRLRAAEGFIDLKAELVQIFEMVVTLRDQYGLYAYLTALDNAGLQTRLQGEIEANLQAGDTKRILLETLLTGKLPAETVPPETNALAKAASRS